MLFDVCVSPSTGTTSAVTWYWPGLGALFSVTLQVVVSPFAVEIPFHDWRGVPADEQKVCLKQFLDANRQPKKE